MPTLSVVLPCFNEEQVIALTIARVMEWIERRGVDAEVIAVDNASTDSTLEVLERLCTQYPRLRLEHRYVNGGYGASVTTGCDAARGEVIAYMDSDGQFTIEDLDRLLPALQRADFVTGIRVHRADTRLRRFLGVCWRTAIRLLFGTTVRDIDCGMKAFHARVWKSIRPTMATGDAFNAELFFRLQACGFSCVQLPVRHFPRRTGKSGSLCCWDVLKAVRDTLRLFFLARTGRISCPPAVPASVSSLPT